MVLLFSFLLSRRRESPGDRELIVAEKDPRIVENFSAAPWVSSIIGIVIEIRLIAALSAQVFHASTFR